MAEILQQPKKWAHTQRIDEYPLKSITKEHKNYQESWRYSDHFVP